jgi:hypothetical protein
MATLLAFCVAIVPRPRFVLAVDALTRSLRLLALANFPPMLVVIVVEKEASLPKAAANSFRVFNASGALATRFETAVPTKAVVATCVLFVPAVAVGASGTPVSDGEASVAYVLAAVADVR